MATLFGLYPFLLKLYTDSGHTGPKFQAGLARAGRRVSVGIVKRTDVTAGKLWCCPSAGSWSAPSPG